MKITGGRQDRFLSNPPADIIGVLLFGPDRGRVKARGAALCRTFLPDADGTFGETLLTADDLTGDPAKLADEMSALSLLGGGRLVRLRLDHERGGAAIGKLLKDFDIHPEKAEAKLVIEAGDMSAGSSLRKAVEASKHFAAIGCYPASTADLRDQVKNQLNVLNIGISADALEFWLPLLEGDHALAAGEVEKMALYKGYGKVLGAEVSVDDIRAVAAGGQSASIDAIITDAMTGQTASADAAFRRAVAGKVNPIQILFALQRHILRLLDAATRMQGGDSAAQAMRALRPPVFRMQERAFEAQLRLWSVGILQRSLRECQLAERRVKSTGSAAEAITSRLLLALAQFAAQKRR